MSFLKGIFSGKVEDEEALESRLAHHDEERIGDDDALEEFKADVKGTIETEIDPQVRQELVDDHKAIAEESSVHLEDGAALLVKGSPAPLELKPFSTELVWGQSEVSEEEQENVARAQQLLKSLPSETPGPVKRQIVEAALKAFEVSIFDIVAGATSEIAALREYIAEVNDNASEFAADSERRIEELEAEIERVRETVRCAEEERELLVGAATEVIQEVEPVLFFFDPSAEGNTHEAPPSIPSLAAGGNGHNKVTASDEDFSELD